MVGDDDGHRGPARPALHDHMAAATAHFGETLLLENPPDLGAGQDAEFTHAPLRIS